MSMDIVYYRPYRLLHSALEMLDGVGVQRNKGIYEAQATNCVVVGNILPH